MIAIVVQQWETSSLINSNREREDAIDWCMCKCSYAVSCELVVYLAWSCKLGAVFPAWSQVGLVIPTAPPRHLMTTMTVLQAWSSRHLILRDGVHLFIFCRLLLSCMIIAPRIWYTFLIHSFIAS